MPPQLSTMLSALGVSPGPAGFAAVERILGGSFSRLPEIRCDPVAQVDAAELAPQEIGDWLAGLPIGREAVLQVAWVADRVGASMGFGTFADNVGDLWFPGVDDVVAVVHSGARFMVLVLDHEELITVSSVGPGPDAR